MTCNRIFQTIRAGDVAAMEDILRSNPESVHDRDDNGWTPLHLVASLGSKTRPMHMDIARLLLASGAVINARTALGWTPIHMIAINGSKESVGVATCLIEHGADLGAKDHRGADWKTHWQHGHEIRKLLSDQD